MQTIAIQTKKPYEVCIGSGLLKHAGEELLRRFGKRTAAIVTDSTVNALYGDTVEAALKDAGFPVCRFVFPAGETSKNIHTLSDLLEFLAQNQITRKDMIIALGGGVTGDLAGFGAAVYLRGIPFVQMPTTLLAAVDSSVGGKTAIDLAAGKNLAGAFHQPSFVLCDVDTFATLPEETLLDGVAEGIKTGILGDEELFECFRSGKFRYQYEEAVARCVRIKGDIVSRDEFDTGERQLLNLGHTLAHGIEPLSAYTVSHGHAVAIGMVMVARAAAKQGICSEECKEKIIEAIRNTGLPTETDITPAALARAALSDKKRQGGTITLVLPEKIGTCRLHPVPVETLEDWTKAGMAR